MVFLTRRRIGQLVTLLSMSLASASCVPSTCTLNDVSYDFGETFEATDGCNECLCAEGGAISCTEIACSNEPDANPEADAGVSDAGTSDAGVADAGVSDAGASDAGETDAGETDAGETDAGETDAGVADAGETDAGVSDAGASDAGETDAGPAPLRVCDPVGNYNDQAGLCTCGTQSSRPPISDDWQDFNCSFQQCVEDCCAPNEMVDPNDIHSCVPKSAPYIQFFAMAPVDDSFSFKGYAPGADRCTLTMNFQNEETIVSVVENLSFNTYDGNGVAFGWNITNNRFFFGGSVDVLCEGEFGSVGESLVVPRIDERFSMNIDYANGVFEFCHDNTFFPAWVSCEVYMDQELHSTLYDCYNLQNHPECRASTYVVFPDGCFQANPVVAPPEDNDIVHWFCNVESDQNDVIYGLHATFNYDATTGALVYTDEFGFSQIRSDF